tara:strand:+ start:979 stop:1893 length:915 start_codon:yes stop_codon:yes gene_type:complete
MNSGVSSSNNLNSVIKSFTEPNNLIMNFAFTLLVIIVFIILLQIGANIMGYFMAENGSPYLFNGTINAKQMMYFEQDPKKDGNVSLLRSDNERGGMEFTWSFWINIEDMEYNKGQYRHVFHKGEANIMTGNEYGKHTLEYKYESDEIDALRELPSSKGLNFPNNAPGVYLHPNTNKMVIFMNTHKALMEKIEVDDFPMNKWVSVIIRCKGNVIDVYVNGVISKRQVLKGVPKQNYGNLYTGMNGGFDGHLSNMRYFNYAVGTREIESIMSTGVNTINLSPKPGTYDDTNYLSASWFGLKSYGQV